MVVRVVCLVLLALSWPVQALGGGPEVDGPQWHEPIRIGAGGAYLRAEAALGEHGIRSGSGTAEDPYVISDWAIQAGQDAAISVSFVDEHILIERVRLTAWGEGEIALDLREAPNVRVVDSTLAGWDALDIDDSGLRLERSAIVNRCEDIVADSDLVMRDVTVSASCDRGSALRLDNTTAKIEDFVVQGAFEHGISADASTSLVLRNAFIHANETMAHGAHVDHVFALSLRGADSLLEAVTVRCVDAARGYFERSTHGVHAAVEGARVEWDAVEVEGCDVGAGVRGTPRESSISLLVRDAGVGLSFDEGDLHVDRIEVRDADRGLDVGSGRLEVRDYASADVGLDVSTWGNGSVHVETEESWLRVKGEHVTTNAKVSDRTVLNWLPLAGGIVGGLLGWALRRGLRDRVDDEPARER